MFDKRLISAYMKDIYNSIIERKIIQVKMGKTLGISPKKIQKCNVSRERRCPGSVAIRETQVKPWDITSYTSRMAKI